MVNPLVAVSPFIDKFLVWFLPLPLALGVLYGMAKLIFRKSL
ncbi:hypothetical protein DFO70_11844 [Cytobacillus firmus]|uniref:Uncharacterized protein n=2 Tax=Cytobacillus TaxID=2675230 RepID=A0A366JLL4_CYTFI|nr:hypothetical protein DFO70_11844 [Cytobacillus firmus]TDX39448.1 hypothetical protein DFO72_11044 [Cytobacillus oceanisediminis]